MSQEIGTTPARFSAALASRYRIEREVGHGGMAVVYLATDVRHDRRVALKVLRPDLAAAIGADRFLQEIKTTANLQHPHIVPLHDSGEVDGVVYYVMPYVEGEGLRDRLDRERQLPIAEAIRIATDVAAALDYAHRHGVVHRDIKPENILLHDGSAVVADFGIALAVQSAGGARLTQTGLSLGTPQYMAPEQAMGERTIDGRADIYALGAVLYETLVGEPPFTGPSMQAIVARMLAEEPRPLRTQRRAIPPATEAAILRALEKIPADRFATAGEFARALSADGPRIAVTHVPRGSRRTGLMLTAAGLAVAAAGALIGTRFRRAEEPPLVTARIAQPLDAPSEFRDVALSPDGLTLAYVSSSAVDGGRIWLRKLSAASVTVLKETEGARQLFWAPDGSAIGFHANGSLRVVTVATGAVRTLASAPLPAGGSWGPDGTILFSPFFHHLMKIPAAGGTPVRALGTDDDITPGSRDPQFLPDGHHFLFWHSGFEAELKALVPTPPVAVPNLDLWVGDLKTGEAHKLADSVVAPRFVAPGTLLYFQVAAGTTLEQPAPLLARRFDADRLTFSGDPVVISPRVDRPDQAPVVSAAGDYLVMREASSLNSGGAHGTIYWIDRATGRRGDPVKGTGSGWAFRSSHDGRRFALAGPGLWIYDAERDVAVKALSLQLAGWPQVWSPDDREIAFNHGPVVAIMRVDGSAPMREIAFEKEDWSDPLDWSPDGNIYYVHEPSQASPRMELTRHNLTTGKKELVPSGSGNVYDARLSPDWSWIAYESDESGRREIYLNSVKSPSTPIRISKAGGGSPRWRHDGKELFFLGADGRIMVVPVQLGSSPVLGEPRRVFDFVVHPEPMGADPYLDTRFEPTPLGDRFLVQSPIGAGAHELTLVQGWRRLLSEKK